MQFEVRSPAELESFLQRLVSDANAVRLEHPQEPPDREVPASLPFFVAELIAAKADVDNALHRVASVGGPLGSEDAARRSFVNRLRFKDTP